jgi:hypothetical protein
VPFIEEEREFHTLPQCFVISDLTPAEDPAKMKVHQQEIANVA